MESYLPTLHSLCKMHASLSRSLWRCLILKVVATTSHFGNVYLTLLSVGLKVNYSKVVKVESVKHLFKSKL